MKEDEEKGKLCIGVGLIMLFAPFAMALIVFVIASLIGLGLTAIFALCGIAYVGTALFLIIKGCLMRSK